MCAILALAPLNLVDLLFYLQGFEVIELGLVRLELCVELVFTALFLQFVPSARLLEENKTPTDSFRSKRTTRPPLSPVAR